jgi:glutamate N-acetyltransferase/amino-acid N-acetyltransferase
MVIGVERPVAREIQEMPAIAGVGLATAKAGIRYPDRYDVMLMCVSPGSSIAGVFTTSRTASPPVEWCRENLKGGVVRAIVVNSGNANAFTGATGREIVRKTASQTAELLNCSASEVFVASTGIIGEPPPLSKLLQALPVLAGSIAPTKWMEAATAIRTTDSYEKVSTKTIKCLDETVTINGIAKGAGMVAPQMATTLAFIATDAAIEHSVLQNCLRSAIDKSFNCISIDGDTSTSDTILMVATGASKVPVAKDEQFLAAFQKQLDELCLDLALQVVSDGEGATKLIKISVSGALDAAAAHRVAMSIANSPLVKAAIGGGDANWGRIIMAAGKAGVEFDQAALNLKIGGIPVASKGEKLDGFHENQLSTHMKQSAILVELDLGIARGKATVWTCDLTEEYVRANGSYRT